MEKKEDQQGHVVGADPRNGGESEKQGSMKPEFDKSDEHARRLLALGFDEWDLNVLRADPTYEASAAFSRDQSTLFALTRNGQDDHAVHIWVPRQSNGRVIVKIGEDIPQLSVAMLPRIQRRGGDYDLRGIPDLRRMLGITPIDDSTCDSELIVDNYASPCAPLLLREVKPWDSSELQCHLIDRLRGVPDSRSLLEKPLTLRQYIDDKIGGIRNSTPVVEVVALLPISNLPRSDGGHYDTKFVPVVNIPNTRYDTQYMIATVADGAAGTYRIITNAPESRIEDIAGSNLERRSWKADLIQDLSDVERLLLPSSAGHMVVVCKPVRILQDHARNPYLEMTNPELDPDRFCPTQSVGGISISQGSHAGYGSLFEGRLEESPDGTPVIYHIRFIGVKPDANTPLDKERLAKSLDTYLRNNI